MTTFTHVQVSAAVGKRNGGFSSLSNTVRHLLDRVLRLARLGRRSPADPERSTENAPLPPFRAATWQSPGNAPTIAGYTVGGGMIYVGSATRDPIDYCVIDPALPASASRAPEQNESCAGPDSSYVEMPPEARHDYLQWLAAGKCDPFTSPVNVVLYFRGLERRLLCDLTEPREEAMLLVELARLRARYSNLSALAPYLTSLDVALSTIALLRREHGLDNFLPDLQAPRGVMPMRLAITLGRAAVERGLLNFELAVSGLIALPENFASGLAFMAEPDKRTDFFSRLKARFEKAFPVGFAFIDQEGPRLSVEHLSYSGLRVDLIAAAGSDALPDPLRLRWTGLIDIAAAVFEELENKLRSDQNASKFKTPTKQQGFSLSYALPQSADQTSKLVSANASAPSRRPRGTAGTTRGLLPSKAPPAVATATPLTAPMPDARAWLEGLTQPLAAVKFSELLYQVMGVDWGGPDSHRDASVRKVLARLGWGMEPDPTGEDEPLSDSDQIFLLSGSASRDATTGAFTMACAAAALTAPVAIKAKSGAAAYAARWSNLARVEFGLPRGDALRVQARLRLCTAQPPDLAATKRLIVDVPIDRREPLARIAATAAADGGQVDGESLTSLEKLYDELGVSRRGLYSTVQRAAAAVIPKGDLPVSALPASALPTVPNIISTDGKKIKVGAGQSNKAPAAAKSTMSLPQGPAKRSVSQPDTPIKTSTTSSNPGQATKDRIGHRESNDRLHVIVARGQMAGTTLRPHLHADGCYVVSPTRFKKDYIRVRSDQSLEDYLKRGLRLRMSAPGLAPSLISPASIRGRKGAG